MKRAQVLALLEEVSRAKPGERFSKLFLAAHRFHVANAKPLAWRALVEAAKRTGMSDDEIDDTIKRARQTNNETPQEQHTMTKAELETEIENLRKRVKILDQLRSEDAREYARNIYAYQAKIANLKRERDMLMAYMQKAIAPIEQQLEAIRQLCDDHAHGAD